jgi:hypothetical protein
MSEHDWDRGPRRLKNGSGPSRLLLDSADIDVPNDASRRRAAALLSTTAAFTKPAGSSSSGATSGKRRKTSPQNPVKTLVTWALVGAAASIAIGVAGSKIYDVTGNASSASRQAPAMAEIPPAPQRSDITPELPTATPSAAPAPASVPLPSPSSLLAPTPAAPHLRMPTPPLGSIEPWVPPPVAETAPTKTSPPSAAAFDEVKDIQAARVAVSNGDTGSAMAVLDNYDKEHPNGELKAESMALRVQVLSNSGKANEARNLANEFQGKFPQHPLTQKVKSVAK